MNDGVKIDSLECISEQMLKLNSFVICGHISPDGDCIGSQLALFHALCILGKEATCILVKDEKIEEGLTFLPGVDGFIPAQEYHATPDAFIACDVPTIDRIGVAKEIHARCKTTFTLDHHLAEKSMSQFNHIDPKKASSTMIIWELIALLGVRANADIAVCAYTGLMTDTGGFRFQNSDASAFEAASQMVRAGVDPAYVAREVFQSRSLASLRLESLAIDRMYVPEDSSYSLSYLKLEDFEKYQGNKTDADPIVNTIRSLKGTQVACMLREQKNSVRGSIRAKDDTDVAAIAGAFDGGGHKAAAGFTIYASLDDALEKVKSLLDYTLVE